MLKLSSKNVIVITLLSSLSFFTHAKTTCQFLPSSNEANIKLCSSLADKNDAKAQNTLGEIYYSEALINRGYHTKARILFEKAAAQGLAVAQYNLGAMYRDEFNNFPIALSWFEKAAAQGNLDAQNSIGFIYENGSGGNTPRPYYFDDNGKNTDPDIPKYKAEYVDNDKLFTSLRTNGIYPYSLFPMSEFGQGVEQNLPLAAQWYEKAANQDHALAQTNLAYLYLFGLGVDKDEKKAFELYQKAAAQNFVPALNSLAFMYAQGLGTEQDIPKAFAILKQSYHLSPNQYIDMAVWKMHLKEEYQHFNLVADLPKLPDQKFREPFSIEDSTDEDYLLEKLNFITLYYKLDVHNRYFGRFSRLFSYLRPSFSTMAEISTGDNFNLEEVFHTKQAVQSSIESMIHLSSFLHGIKKDAINSQLWKVYAVTMGDRDTPENYPWLYKQYNRYEY